MNRGTLSQRQPPLQRWPHSQPSGRPPRSATTRTARPLDERLPARRPRRPDQARHLPPVRQRALSAGQPERAVGPRADAAPAELPEEQRHSAEQALHDPDLAHRGRHPQLADRASTPTGWASRCRTRTTTTSRDRRADVHLRVQVLDVPSRHRPTRCRTWSTVTPARRRRRLRRGSRYTRAGCDVGNVSVANTVLENNSIAPGGDIYNVYRRPARPRRRSRPHCGRRRLRRHRRPLREDRVQRLQQQHAREERPAS